MTKYTEVQIIKHALQHYIKREGAEEKDIKREKELLDEYTRKAELLKERYRIRSKEVE